MNCILTCADSEGPRIDEPHPMETLLELVGNACCVFARRLTSLLERMELSERR